MDLRVCLQLDRRLLGELADRALGLALAPVDGAAWKHPDARHERLLGPAANQQHLELAIAVATAAAQQNDRRGGTRGGRHVAHVGDDNLRAVTAETETKQLWICTSCGFIYDPDEGDPDGGIPPGTSFDEIPDSWFCPVCGARKADFEPYDG